MQQLNYNLKCYPHKFVISKVFHSHNIQSICPRLIKGLRCTVEVSVNAGSRSAPSCLLNYNYVLILCSTYLRQLQLCTNTLFNLFASTATLYYYFVQPICVNQLLLVFQSKYNLVPVPLFNNNFAYVLCSTYLRHLLLVFLSKCNLVPVPLFNIFASTIISILTKYDLVPVSLFNYNYVLVLCSTYLRQILLVFLSKLNLVRVPMFNYNFALVNLCDLFASTILHHSNFYCRNRVELWLSALFFLEIAFRECALLFFSIYEKP